MDLAQMGHGGGTYPLPSCGSSALPSPWHRWETRLDATALQTPLGHGRKEGMTCPTVTWESLSPPCLPEPTEVPGTASPAAVSSHRVAPGGSRGLWTPSGAGSGCAATALHLLTLPQKASIPALFPVTNPVCGWGGSTPSLRIPRATFCLRTSTWARTGSPHAPSHGVPVLQARGPLERGAQKTDHGERGISTRTFRRGQMNIHPGRWGPALGQEG